MAKKFKTVEPLQVDLDKALSSAAAAHRASNFLGLTYADPQTGSIYTADDLCRDDVWAQTQVTPTNVKGKGVKVEGSGPLVRIFKGVENELKDLGAAEVEETVTESEDSEFSTAIDSAANLDTTPTPATDELTVKIKTLKIKRKVVLDVIVTRNLFEKSYAAAQAAKKIATSNALAEASAAAEARHKVRVDQLAEEYRKNPEAAKEAAPVTPKVVLA